MNTIYTIKDRDKGAVAPLNHPPHRARCAVATHLANLVAVILAWMLTLLCHGTAGAQSYTTSLIQSADPSFYAWSLTQQGEVVGHYHPDGSPATPVVWRNGVLVRLPLLPGTVGGIVRAGNNVGQFVGFCYDADGAYHACMWENGSVRALPALPGTWQAEATDINDAGGVTGYAILAVTAADGSVYPRQDAVVWQGGSVAAIVPPYPDEQSYAHAIDASGRIAVSIYDDWMGGWMPGRWTPDVPNGLAGAVELLAWGGFAGDINDSGVVCGSDTEVGTAIWNGSTRTVIGVLPGSVWAGATGINADGTVVGTATLYDDGEMYADYDAFIWTAQDGMRSLDALLLDPSNVFGDLIEAVEINNAGQILAMAAGGFVLLTPSALPPPLPAPTGLHGQAGNNFVVLSWSDVPVASGYNVKRATVSGGPYTTIATGVASPSYVDQTVVNGVRYYYVVSALADTRESANSNEASAKPMAPPVAPTGLAAKVAKAKVTLTWNQSTSPEIARNRIYRSTNGGAYVLVADIAAGLTWTDNSARSKTGYRYVVTAVNSIGLQSPYSNSVAATPK